AAVAAALHGAVLYDKHGSGLLRIGDDFGAGAVRDYRPRRVVAAAAKERRQRRREWRACVHRSGAVDRDDVGLRDIVVAGEALPRRAAVGAAKDAVAKTADVARAGVDDVR